MPTYGNGPNYHRFRPPGHPPTGDLPVWHSNHNIERLPPGPTTSKGSMNVYCMMKKTTEKLFKGTLTRDILAFFIIFNIKSVFF